MVVRFSWVFERDNSGHKSQLTTIIIGPVLDSFQGKLGALLSLLVFLFTNITVLTSRRERRLRVLLVLLFFLFLQRTFSKTVQSFRWSGEMRLPSVVAMHELHVTKMLAQHVQYIMRAYIHTNTHKFIHTCIHSYIYIHLNKQQKKVIRSRKKKTLYTLLNAAGPLKRLFVAVCCRKF